MALLGVNIDHVATLRQARGGTFPDPAEAAIVCQDAGADSIVAHLREDRRHIQDADVLALKKKLKIKLNMEISADPSVLKTVYQAHPHCVTFVPEKRRERTTESGLDVVAGRRRLKPILRRLREEGISVSLFVDPDREQISASRDLGAGAVELHTGDYANSLNHRTREAEAVKIEKAAAYSNGLGLLTHVGHGLDYENVGRIAEIRGICEFNIGYSIVTQSLFWGLRRAVSEMKQRILSHCPPGSASR